MSLRNHGDILTFIAAVLQVALCIGSLVWTTEGARDAYVGIHIHFHSDGAEKIELVPRPSPAANPAIVHGKLNIILQGDLPTIAGPPEGVHPQVGPRVIDQEPILVTHGEGTLFLFADRYSWLLGSGDDADGPSVVHDGRVIPAAHVVRHFRWPELARQLEEATEVIAVGMASCEGESQEEYRRAGARADQILRWLREAHGSDRFPSLRAQTLNLGRYGQNCPNASAEATQFQRRLVVLALKRGIGGQHLDNHDLIEALRSSNLLGVDPYEYEAATLSEPEAF